jgi:hypothetical protein
VRPYGWLATIPEVAFVALERWISFLDGVAIFSTYDSPSWMNKPRLADVMRYMLCYV